MTKKNIENQKEFDTTINAANQGLNYRISKSISELGHCPSIPSIASGPTTGKPN